MPDAENDSLCAAKVEELLRNYQAIERLRKGCCDARAAYNTGD